MPGGPPALLRSDSRPLGLEGLRQADALKVKLGNALTYFSCHVLALALTLHVAFTLENALRSRLWLCPSVQRLLPAVWRLLFVLLERLGRNLQGFLE